MPINAGDPRLGGCNKHSSSPSPDFLDSKLIVRPGIDDLGSTTVRQFVDVLTRVQKPNGGTTELLGWEKTASGYTLRAKIASEFDLNFQWSKAEKIALLQDASLDNGESVPGMQFYMLVAGMPKVPVAPTTENSDKTTNQTNSEPASPSPQAEIAAANAVTKRTVAGAVLQAFECNDTCQLKYADASGQSHTAICMDTKGCRSWAEDPKGFLPLIGAKADLVIGKKYVPEGGITMDNVVDISLNDVDTSTPSK
jgi:hypothetical protein